jgi:16S rRNA (guanine527-N7)-methyltransferase
MNPFRIAELLEPFLAAPIINRADPGGAAQPGQESALLSPDQLQQISTYIDILLRWNARINLTAIRDPEEIVTRHFGESLFAARYLFPQPNCVGTAARASPDQSRRGSPPELEAEPGQEDEHKQSPARLTVADVGSGAGFPGLPVKLWAPPISLTLIESSHKKAAFLREVVRALTLTDVNIRNTRAETFHDSGQGGSIFDVVTLRAVERFESILPIAATLVSPAGRLALLIGASQQNQTRAALSHFAWSESVSLPGSRTRVLLIGKREAEL